MKANQVNAKLIRILQNNKDSDRGRNLDFRYIKIVNGFRYLSPISEYDSIAPLIELTTRIGETGIYTSHPLIGYSLTSGTTGVPRFIPCTKEHIEDYQKEFLSIVGKEKTMLLMESLPRDKKFKDGVYLDSISGLVLQSLRKKIEGLNIVNPEPILYLDEDCDSEYLRAFFALSDAGINQIVSPFSWGVVNFLDYIKKNYIMLLKDIENGCIDPSVKISDKLSKELKTYIRPNKERAEALKALYSEEFFDGPWVEKVWPKMSKVVAGGGGSFSIYSKTLKKYLGKISHNYGLYASSEAVIGKAIQDDSDVYTLADSSVFLEFLPVGGETSETLLADELEVGKSYKVLVTNNAGLYRYMLGDVIQVTEMKNGIPNFKLMYRSAQELVIGKTKITEDKIFEAICALEKKTGISVADFTFGEEDDKCLILLEPAADSSNMKKCAEASLDDIADIMENEISDSGDKIECIVHFSEPQTQLLYRDVRRYREKAAIDQIKPVRVLDNPIKVKFFEKMIER